MVAQCVYDKMRLAVDLFRDLKLRGNLPIPSSSTLLMTSESESLPPESRRKRDIPNQSIAIDSWLLWKVDIITSRSRRERSRSSLPMLAKNSNHHRRCISLSNQVKNRKKRTCKIHLSFRSQMSTTISIQFCHHQLSSVKLRCRGQARCEERRLPINWGDQTREFRERRKNKLSIT